MSFQETFNERVMPAANRAFGVTATVFVDGSIFQERTIFLGRRNFPTDGRPRGIDPLARLRFQEIVISASELTFDDRAAFPERWCEVEVADINGEPRGWTVFPANGGVLWRFYDHTETRLTFYAIDKRDLVKVCWTRPDGSRSEIYYGIPGPIRATEQAEAVRGASSVSSLHYVQRQEISVIPKESQQELNDSGDILLQQPDDSEPQEWFVESVAFSTPSLVTLEVKRDVEKRGPEIRSDR
jgi:hypothetical protein